MSPELQDPLRWLDAELDALARQGLKRQLRRRTSCQGPVIEIDGQSFVNFGSNDYLNLAADPRLAVAASRAFETCGWGAGASPLVNGRSDLHARLEAELASFEAADAAMLFSSGFAANVGAVSALVGRGDAIFSDARNHASLIDGARQSKAAVHVYRHCDVNHLKHLLKENREARRRLIVTDSLFSMDGNFAPLVALAELRNRYDAMLLVDEAHATGVFGAEGRGVAEHLDVGDQVDVKIGTISKALGCVGGFVCGRRSLIDWLLNRARPYVFSTAHPDASAAAALEALKIVRNEPNRRYGLLARASVLRERLMQIGCDIGRSESQIIPVIVGDPNRAIQFADQLAAAGIFVPAIRPPSVPEGESLLRLSVTSGHTDEMLDQLVETIRRLVDTA